MFRDRRDRDRDIARLYREVARLQPNVWSLLGGQVWRGCSQMFAAKCLQPNVCKCLEASWRGDLGVHLSVSLGTKEALWSSNNHCDFTLFQIFII